MKTIAIETENGISTARIDFEVSVGETVTVPVALENSGFEMQTGIVVEILD